MKTITKITSAALTALLLSAMTLPAFAEAAPSEKEEVIYIMTDASGKVTDMEAVNLFAGGDIIDYGDYFRVKMLNTTDPINQDGNKITFSSDADKIYYQGTMKSTVIPWNISIRYFLDGKEYAAEEIAGKSGALEIRFSVGKNESCKGGFYDGYALQASFTLDTDLCKNIVSNGATVANVGSDKQLTYTILPGKGIDTVIRADVTDFAMDTVAINGVRLNMNFEVDDAELMDKVNEIISAIGSIDDGAAEVRDGTGRLYDATGTLNDKVGELHSGVGELTNGAGDLSSGLSNITAKNDQLTGAAYTAYEGLYTLAAAQAVYAQLLQSGYTDEPANACLQSAEGQAAIAQAVANMTEEQKAQIRDAFLQQTMASDEVTSRINAAVAAVSAAAKQVSELKGQLDSYGAFYQGLRDYTGAVGGAAVGAGDLKRNMDTLYSNTGTLKRSVGALHDAVDTLYSGTKDLASGTSEFVEQTSDMDTQISEEIDSMTASITGSNAEAASFVSDKNTHVDSVQFVIKTAAIEKPEAAVRDAAEEAPLTFWQKLLRLFGLY